MSWECLVRLKEIMLTFYLFISRGVSEKLKKKHEVSICNIIWLDKREASALWALRSLERNTPHILFIYFARGYFLKKIKYNYEVSSSNIIWSNKGEASAFWAPRSLEKKKSSHFIYLFCTRLFSEKQKNYEVSFCNIIWLDKREASTLWAPRSLDRSTPYILFIYFARGYFLKNKI